MNKQEIALNKHRDALHKKPNVVAVGLGYKQVKGKKTKKLSILCFVKKKVDKNSLSVSGMIPSKLDGIDTDVIEVGEIKALEDPKIKHRPVPGGVSVGHYAITAGTLGCWVKKDNKYRLLSNNHVLANSNSATVGDNILQPGTYDGGANPADKIAELAEFVPIKWIGTNYVDAALAIPVGEDDVPPPEEPSNCPIAGFISRILNGLASIFKSQTKLEAKRVYSFGLSDIVLDEIMNLGNPSGFGEVELGDPLVKMGRTTGVTYGEVLAINATSNVSYGNGKTAYFADQILAGNMSAGGDSGSAVLNENTNELVGLLFAGSDTITIINKISRVREALNIELG